MISRVIRGRRRGWWAVTLSLLASLVLAGGAYGAFTGLPLSGQQVNDDPPTIDPNQNANLTDLTAGSLAGAARVPWAAFAQSEADGSAQIVVRAFKNGAWQTEGFPESLNVDSVGGRDGAVDRFHRGRTGPCRGSAGPSRARALGASHRSSPAGSPQQAAAGPERRSVGARRAGGQHAGTDPLAQHQHQP